MLDLPDTQVTGKGLEHLKGLTAKLRGAGPRRHKGQRRHLNDLSGLTETEWLDLGETYITVAGFGTSEKLGQLRWLNLSCAAIHEGHGHPLRVLEGTGATSSGYTCTPPVTDAGFWSI